MNYINIWLRGILNKKTLFHSIEEKRKFPNANGFSFNLFNSSNIFVDSSALMLAWLIYVACHAFITGYSLIPTTVVHSPESPPDWCLWLASAVLPPSPQPVKPVTSWASMALLLSLHTAINQPSAALMCLKCLLELFN